MKKLVVSLLLIVLPILGLFDAGYVTYEELSGRVPMCRPPFECGKVLDSQWAYIAGIPLSVYGLFFYGAVLAFALMNYMELDFKVPVFGTIPRTLRFLTIFGFGFSMYLVFVMGVLIKAWCLWCLVSAITTSSLFLVGFGLDTAQRTKLSTPAPKP